jgi:predicted O-methyltransferase YrrM
MIPYIPKVREYPKVVNVFSAWGDIPTILKDIIIRFRLQTDLALDFGVLYGYSTSALANYFNNVIGIDTFRYDIYDNDPSRTSEYKKVSDTLERYKNVKLVESKYQDFIKTFDKRADFIHIDIIHSYEDTYQCGEWAVNHSDCVVFHDTITEIEVGPAVADLALKYNMKFYNYKQSNGLGILVR